MFPDSFDGIVSRPWVITFSSRAEGPELLAGWLSRELYVPPHILGRPYELGRPPDDVIAIYSGQHMDQRDRTGSDASMRRSGWCTYTRDL